jgi:hypothetical protein
LFHLVDFSANSWKTNAKSEVKKSAVADFGGGKGNQNLMSSAIGLG